MINSSLTKNKIQCLSYKELFWLKWLYFYKFYELKCSYSTHESLYKISVSANH
jgi:hypothetical protein